MDDLPDNTKEKANQAADNSESVKAGAGKSSRLKVLVILIVLILFACIGYTYNQVLELQEAVDAAQSRSATLNEAMDERIRVLKSTVSVIDSKLISMARSLSEVYERQPYNSEDWALAEVEYLLIIAFHRLLLEKDINTALVAMQSAESRLAGLRNPDLIPVREQLVTDINQLEAVNRVDITGLAIYLADIIDRSSGLPLKKPEAVQIKNDGNSGERSDNQPDQSMNIKSALARAWEEIKSLVVIRKGSESRYEFLLPEQSYFLGQNLRLELENARLSVLNRDTDNFRTSITLITDWLLAYYDNSDASVANIIDTMSKMADIELDPPVPDISSSLETLRAYMKQQ